jgi:hypothetical protein
MKEGSGLWLYHWDEGQRRQSKTTIRNRNSKRKLPREITLKVSSDKERMGITLMKFGPGSGMPQKAGLHVSSL